VPLIPEPEYIDSLMEHADAVCLSGAVNDVDPLRYGREPKPHLGPVVPRRDETDSMLLAAAEAKQLPVLAVGGVTLDSAKQLPETGCAGFAAIGQFAAGPEGDLGRTVTAALAAWQNPGR